MGADTTTGSSSSSSSNHNGGVSSSSSNSRMTSSSSLEGPSSSSTSHIDSRNVGVSGGPIVREEITSLTPNEGRFLVDTKTFSLSSDNPSSSSLLSGVNNENNPNDNPLTMTPAQRLAQRRNQRHLQMVIDYQNQLNNNNNSNSNNNNNSNLIENPFTNQRQQPNNQPPIPPRQFRVRSFTSSKPSSPLFQDFSNLGQGVGWGQGQGQDSNFFVYQDNMGYSSSGSIAAAETTVTKKPPRRVVHVFCAGDDDQSIYAWRGAKVELMRRFQYDFPNGRVVKFGISYRLPVRAWSITPPPPTHPPSLCSPSPFSLSCCPR